MSKLIVFAPRDAKLNVFMNPMFFQHPGQALRTWDTIVNDDNPQNMLHKYPADFSLYRIGTFDSETGVFESTHHELLATGADVQKKSS